jgi:hypothetical protein
VKQSENAPHCTPTGAGVNTNYIARTSSHTQGTTLVTTRSRTVCGVGGGGVGSEGHV